MCTLSEFSSFLWLNDILLYVYTTFSSDNEHLGCFPFGYYNNVWAEVYTLVYFSSKLYKSLIWNLYSIGNRFKDSARGYKSWPDISITYTWEWDPGTSVEVLPGDSKCR
jgi:hypothetical protein